MLNRKELIERIQHIRGDLKRLIKEFEERSQEKWEDDVLYNLDHAEDYLMWAEEAIPGWRSERGVRR